MGGPFFELRILPALGALAVLCLGRERPDAFMDGLQAQLGAMGWRSPLVLDLLMPNGSLSRRFMAMHFDGQRLDWLGAKISPQEQIDPRLIALCDAFYRSRPSLLEQSALSDAARERFLSPGQAG